MEMRRSIRMLRQSGMMDMMQRYTFENYTAESEDCEKVKQFALDYCSQPSGWFYIHGRAGSGKTHICTAICNTLMHKGNPIKYMLWRDESVALKGLVNSQSEYAERINKLKTVKVLYIDDFFKSKTVTDADVNLAFELLNFRYNDSKLRTIISSEKSIEEILSIDEAVGSRIYERSKGFYLDAPSSDWRLK
jgi:DNA replication protein DnaC